MKTLSRKLVFLLAVVLLLNRIAFAHPGSGIIVDSQGNVFVGDINGGLLKFTPDGKVSVVLREAGHWLAVDTDKKFTRMDFQKSEHWPRWFKHRNPPSSELALISDGGSPLVVHRDGNLYFICDDERMIPAGLQIGRLSPDGTLALVSPGLKARTKELGGIKGLASGPDDSLYAVTPGAVLKVKLDGTFSTVKQPVVAPDCGQEPAFNGLAVGPRGDIYLAATGCRRVLKLRSDGSISTFLETESPWSPTGLTFRGEDVYIAEWTNALSEGHDYRPRVRKVGRDGKVTTMGTLPE